MTRDIKAIEKLARQTIADLTGIDEDDIPTDATLESLNLDSLDLIELVINLEDELGITLDFVDNMEDVEQITFEEFLKLLSEE